MLYATPAGALSIRTPPRAKFLKELASKNAEAAKTAYAYFQGSLGGSYGSTLQQSTGLDGAVAACLFNHPEFISSSQAAEVIAFHERRAEMEVFRQSVEHWRNELTSETERWSGETKSEITEFLDSSQKLFQEHNTSQTEAFGRAMSEFKARSEELETLYRTKLRLDEPAAYWKSLEKAYITQGRWWIGGTAGAILVLAGWVSYLLYRPPAIITSDKFTLGGFKAAIFIAAVISGFLYLTNLGARVATSSYHLARDARERLNLTHVFLALIKDNAIESKEREIIFSALFSRSDTGLLKHDSGPTIPTPLGSILEHVKPK